MPEMIFIECDEEYFLEVDVQYLENLQNFFIDLPFLPESIKIGKVDKLVANLHNEEEYITYMGKLKQALKYGLVLKKVHRVIKFNLKVG